MSRWPLGRSMKTGQHRWPIERRRQRRPRRRRRLQTSGRVTSSGNFRLAAGSWRVRVPRLPRHRGQRAPALPTGTSPRRTLTIGRDRRDDGDDGDGDGVGTEAGRAARTPRQVGTLACIGSSVDPAAAIRLLRRRTAPTSQRRRRRRRRRRHRRRRQGDGARVGSLLSCPFFSLSLSPKRGYTSIPRIEAGIAARYRGSRVIRSAMAASGRSARILSASEKWQRHKQSYPIRCSACRRRSDNFQPSFSGSEVFFSRVDVLIDTFAADRG